MSHSLVALRRGNRIGGITQYVFGGVPEMKDERPAGRAEFQMGIAGSSASFVRRVDWQLLVIADTWP